MAQNPQFVDVPAGTRSSQCRGADCRAVVYWIETPRGKKMPVDCDVDGGYAPSETEPGQGVAHWGTCANVADFQRHR